MLRTHLTVLEASASTYSNLPAFRIPIIDSETGAIAEWDSISYEQFHSDVLRVARYWLHILQADNIPQGSVIGMW